MKIDITHSDFKTGVFKKTKHYRVKFAFTFNDEEKAIIKEANLEDVLAFEVPPSSHLSMTDPEQITFGRLANWGFDYVALTPSQVSDLEEEVKDYLPNLKEFLESNGGELGEDTSLEF